MGKLKLRTNPGAKFSTLQVSVCRAMHLLHSIAIQANFELKTQPKQLLGSLRLDIALPAYLDEMFRLVEQP